MASVSTLFKQVFVRNLSRILEEDGETLCDLLKELTKNAIVKAGGGKYITSTSANGHTTQFQIPYDFSPMDSAELVAEIINRKEEAQAKLVDDGNATPTDAQIITEILRVMQPIRGYIPDFSLGRIGACPKDDE